MNKIHDIYDCNIGGSGHWGVKRPQKSWQDAPQFKCNTHFENRSQDTLIVLKINYNVQASILEQRIWR